MGKKGKHKGSGSAKTFDTKKEKKINPFEIHINRVKYDVVGRKTTEDRGLPGVARAKALKKVRIAFWCSEIGDLFISFCSSKLLDWH